MMCMAGIEKHKNLYSDNIYRGERLVGICFSKENHIRATTRLLTSHTFLNYLGDIGSCTCVVKVFV